MGFNNNSSIPQWAIEKIEATKRDHLSFLDLNGWKKNPKLTFIPDVVYELHYLTKIDASCNEITFIPNDIRKFSYLEELDLCENIVTELPRDIQELNALKVLNLVENQFINFPRILFGLRQNLTHLELQGNPFKNITPLEHACLNNNPIDLNELYKIEISRNKTERRKISRDFKHSLGVNPDIAPKILEELQKYIKQNFIYEVKLEDSIVMLNARYNELKGNIGKGIIKFDDIQIENNRIRATILEILEKFENLS